MRIAIVALLVSVAAGPSVAAQQPPPQVPPGTAPQPPAPQPPATEPGQPPPGQTPPGQTTPIQPAPGTTPQPGRVLLGDAGLIFFPVKPDKVTDFEKIMEKLKEARTTSEDPVRKQQAAGWKVFKAVEPGPNNTVLYVFLIDPAVKGTDYAFWKTIYDAFPKEVQELYRLYTAATSGGQSLLNLQLVNTFGATEPPK